MSDLPRRIPQKPGQIARAIEEALNPFEPYITAGGAPIYIRALDDGKYAWVCFGCGATGQPWPDPEPASEAADSHARTCREPDQAQDAPQARADQPEDDTHR